MILDVSQLASEQMRLARELDEARLCRHHLEQTGRVKDPDSSFWRWRDGAAERAHADANRDVANLTLAHRKALAAYEKACAEQLAEAHQPAPADDQPNLFGDG